MRGDGDFRSEECIEFLKEADIVVTNPPFSLFREYLPQLIQHEKKFIVLGNMNAFKYSEIFPFFQQGRCWYGPSITSGDRWFQMPERLFEPRANTKVLDGQYFTKVMGVRWFTNLDHKQRHQELTLWATYNANDYPKYDNYNAIEVSRAKEIPKDYDGIMGVPISFMDRYNPNQFEILGISNRDRKHSIKCKVYQQGDHPRFNDFNASVVLKRNGVLDSLYTRLFIRRKQ